MPAKVTPINQSKKLQSGWNPSTEGKHFSNFIENLDFDSSAKKRVIKESKAILGMCHNPSIVGKTNTVGSVIGYVQSGKTTSFNALTMMAIDNGFKLIIVLGGRTKNLLNQNREEYEKTLKFFIDTNQSLVPKNTLQSVNNLPLKTLVKRHEFFPAKSLITVHLKHQGHITQLTKRLNEFPEILEKQNVLIIDDEADNASLNSKVNSNYYNPSAVYQAIKNLRAVIPRHSFVQYTATPQALLLTSKDDHLSPKWVRFITPGDTYVGTKDLFHEDSHVPIGIPIKDVAQKDIKEIELPDSFHQSLKSYLLSAAQAVLLGRKKWLSYNITMMIHPHRETDPQDNWGIAIIKLIDDWRYEINESKSGFLNFNKKLFHNEYLDLKKSTANLKEDINNFDDLYDLVLIIIEELHISVLNASKKNLSILPKTVDWNNRFNIVIGGDLLDRGYVVKGLVTTYMPRTESINSDTLQQRGRFYGYKKPHLGFIRVWLTDSAISSFQAYLESETALYQSLKDWSLSGENLRLWIRLILLDPKMKPCRSSIIGMDLIPKYLDSGGWYWPRKPILLNKNNPMLQGLIDEFKDSFVVPSETSNWTPATKYLRADNLDLTQVTKKILDFEVDYSDQPKWLMVRTHIAILKSQGYKASISLMGTQSKEISSFEKRYRTLSEKLLSTSVIDEATGELVTQISKLKELKKLHQGANQNKNFPGEKEIGDPSKKVVNFQIHKLCIKEGAREFESLVLAVKLPRKRGLIGELQADGIYVDEDDIYSNSD